MTQCTDTEGLNLSQKSKLTSLTSNLVEELNTMKKITKRSTGGATGNGVLNEAHQAINATHACCDELMKPNECPVPRPKSKHDELIPVYAAAHKRTAKRITAPLPSSQQPTRESSPWMQFFARLVCGGTESLERQ